MWYYQWHTVVKMGKTYNEFGPSVHRDMHHDVGVVAHEGSGGLQILEVGLSQVAELAEHITCADASCKRSNGIRTRVNG